MATDSLPDFFFSSGETEEDNGKLVVYLTISLVLMRQKRTMANW